MTDAELIRELTETLEATAKAMEAVIKKSWTYFSSKEEMWELAKANNLLQRIKDEQNANQTTSR